MAEEKKPKVYGTGVVPRTMKVKSEEHGGATVVINKEDFDEEVHEKLDEKPSKAEKAAQAAGRPKLGQPAPGPHTARPDTGGVATSPPGGGGGPK